MDGTEARDPRSPHLASPLDGVADAGRDCDVARGDQHRPAGTLRRKPSQTYAIRYNPTVRSPRQAAGAQLETDGTLANACSIAGQHLHRGERVVVGEGGRERDQAGRAGPLRRRATARRPQGGATKINKVLFSAEFAHMRVHGVPITGVEYQKLRQGPAPRRLVPVRERLVSEGAAELVRDRYLGYPLDRLVPRREADLALFSLEEIKQVDQAIEALWNKTAAEVSKLSHHRNGLADGLAWRNDPVRGGLSRLSV